MVVSIFAGVMVICFAYRLTAEKLTAEVVRIGLLLYAHVNRRAGGNGVKQSDRWIKSQILVGLAKECFLEELRSSSSIPITPDAATVL